MHSISVDPILEANLRWLPRKFPIVLDASGMCFRRIASATGFPEKGNFDIFVLKGNRVRKAKLACLKSIMLHATEGDLSVIPSGKEFSSVEAIPRLISEHAEVGQNFLPQLPVSSMSGRNELPISVLTSAPREEKKRNTKIKKNEINKGLKIRSSSNLVTPIFLFFFFSPRNIQLS